MDSFRNWLVFGASASQCAPFIYFFCFQAVVAFKLDFVQFPFECEFRFAIRMGDAWGSMGIRWKRNYAISFGNHLLVIFKGNFVFVKNSSLRSDWPLPNKYERILCAAHANDGPTKQFHGADEEKRALLMRTNKARNLHKSADVMHFTRILCSKLPIAVLPRTLCMGFAGKAWIEKKKCCMKRIGDVMACIRIARCLHCLLCVCCVQGAVVLPGDTC